MNEFNSKLTWIVRLAVWSDAAINAQLGFVGARDIADLDDSVVDELEMASLSLGTCQKQHEVRIFGFNKNLEHKVQKVMGFDVAKARDAGTNGDDIIAEFELRPTALFGPAICSELLEIANISCRIEMTVDMLDASFLMAQVFGAITEVRVEKAKAEVSEQHMASVIDNAFDQLTTLAKNCEKANSYDPFYELIKQWEHDS